VYEEKTKLLDAEYRKVAATSQERSSEDRDNIFHMLIVEHKNELDALLQAFQQEHGPEMEALDYYLFYIELQKKNVQLCDKFSETISPLMSYSLFDNQDPRNLIKECPHCGLIWFKTEGCDGKTNCGATGFQ